ncbi:Coiled-coil domain-containing protein 177 [Trichoplax sp. H2]|nr:Coiled-coil domain-containing protein 177 [Trichoplax sp. H2]|eukprot:RDD40934.1 Coiled-coil domain-containing protein 177 [Trichoplax sp. H2]
MATKTVKRPSQGNELILGATVDDDEQNILQDDGDSDDKEVEEIMMLNLYNFDDDKMQNCRYILTSPRSLEACARHDIKPTELLYKSLSEVEIQCKEADPNLSYSQIYTNYRDMEAERRRKLKLCREERERMMWQENETIATDVVDPPHEEIKESGRTGKVLRKYSNDELERIVSEFRRESLPHSEQDVPQMIVKKHSKPKSKKQPARNRNSKVIKNRKKKLESINIGVPEKDRKIIELMLNRHREEEESDRVRRLANLNWEQQRLALDEKMAMNLNRKKEEIRESNRARLAAQEQQKAKVDYENEVQRKFKIEKIQEKDAKLAAITSAKQKLLEQQIQLKILQDQSKKKNQEYNLKVEEEYRNAKAIQNHLRNLRIEENARINRQIRSREDQLRIGANNLKSELEHDKKKYDNEMKTREDQHYLQNSIELKHLRADTNYKRQQQIKAEEMRAEIMKMQKQFRKQQETAKLMTEEHDEWLKHLQLEEDLKLEKAETIAALVKEEKRFRAKEQREARQAGQKLNMKKIKKQEELKQRYTTAQAMSKDRKRQQIAAAKEENLSKLRDTARATSLMRYKVKEMTAKSSFDKMSAIPKQYASIEGRHW